MSRTSATVSADASLPGSATSTIWTWPIPSTGSTAVAEVTPSTSPTRSASSSTTAASSVRVTTTTGSDVPAGNDSASRSEAVIASGVSRNWSSGGSPLTVWVRPKAIAASTPRVARIETPGARATVSPMRRQSERDSLSTCWPSRGTCGQKIHRPKTTRAPGSSTRTPSAATTTPTAEASPRPRVLGKTDSSRLSTPTTTVLALAMIASEARRRATAMAWCRSWWRRSSSR